MPPQITAWVEWPDFVAPAGVELVPPTDAAIDADDLQRITFFVPRYMGGPGAIEPAARMPKLRILQLATAGYDDALPFLAPGVTLCNARGVHDESTAELAVALAIAGRRGFRAFGEGQSRGEWLHSRRPALTDARIAVIGHGSIGRTVMRMLSAFTVDVTAFSRRGTDDALPISSLAAAIDAFDVVIVLVPLTDATVGLFDAGLLARMKNGALLVNVARGAVVDTEALMAELRSGRLHAALDVTDPEPLPPTHPLWTAPNCLITPHVGGDTSAFEPRARALVSGQLQRLVDDTPLINVVSG